MRRLTALTVSVILAVAAPAAVGGAGPGRACDCPTVEVTCPGYAVSGAPVTFNASVKNAPADSVITYNWVVSAGTIEKGQGTNSLTLDTTGLDNTYATAAVDVTGLPASCPNSASCAVSVSNIKDLHKIDEYGNIGWGDEKARLDNFAIELQADPGMGGYIICYGGRVGREGEARRRCRRALNYLTGKRGIDAGRVVTLDGGFREELTVQLWPRPAGTTPPPPAPTVDPAEVKFVGARSSRRRERRRR